jgi:uncharacterized protein (TIGR03437 family)
VLVRGPSADYIHILTGCGNYSGPCVTHADGTLVSVDAPAKPGEALVVYAVGLGLTNPAVATGQRTPAPAPVVADNIFIQFD